MKACSIITTILLLLFFSNVNAFIGQNAFQRSDQQAITALNKGQALQAAALFTQPEWKAVAYYRAGLYQQAYDLFKTDTTATGYYNSGNALAFMGRYTDAIHAYDQALKLQANFYDAKFNKALIEQLLRSSAQQPDENNKTNPSDNSSSNSTPKNNNNQMPQNQNSSSQENQKNSNADTSNSSEHKSKADEKTSSASSNQKLVNATKSEQQQAVNQWLASIPDESGGLLEQKFLRDHASYQQLEAKGEQAW